jgi:hypothetical protein
MEDARADALEQRMGNVESTLDEIRLLLREQARPRQRQGRRRRRLSRTADDDGSDGSMVSENRALASPGTRDTDVS